MHRSRLFVILTFIALGVLSRLLPHPPNFTAINAISLFSACYMGSIGFSLAIILPTMFLSDCILGFHQLIPFVYLSVSLVSILGRGINSDGPLLRLPVCCVVSSLLFFVIVNFGVWLFDGLYPQTPYGLVLCYVASLPFLATQILGDLFYGILLFNCFRFFERQFPSISLSYATR